MIFQTTREMFKEYMNLSSKTQQNKMVIAGYVLYGDEHCNELL